MSSLKQYQHLATLVFHSKEHKHCPLWENYLLWQPCLSAVLVSLTFILGLKLKARKETIEFSYPEERVMLVIT